VNIVTMVLETDDPSKKDTLFWLDQAMMSFYVFELIARGIFFRRKFLFGPVRYVLWNYLDCVVVVAGVTDQWLMPCLTGALEGHTLQSTLQLLRLLRVFRVLKIVRIFRETDLSWTEEARFQTFIGAVITFNSLLMGVETDIEWGGWFYIEQVLLSIYVFELAVRLKRFGFFFISWKNRDFAWNVLDSVIVVSSTMDTWIIPLVFVLRKSFVSPEPEATRTAEMRMGQVMMLMRMARLMRILRLVKLIKAVRPLYLLVTGVLNALQGVLWVLVLTVTVLYAMGIMATHLIGHGMVFPPGHEVPDDIVHPFRSVPASMFTLFRQMSGASSDQEVNAVDELMKSVPSVKFAFVFFMISSSWTLLSILTAVVSENMISTTGEQQVEMKLVASEEDRARHIQKLSDLFLIIDTTGDGLVSQEELHEFLSHEANALATAKSCRVPVRDVKEVLETLYTYGREVTLEEFVESLADVRHTATEKSMMKIDAKMCSLQARMEKLIGNLDETSRYQRARSASKMCSLQARNEELTERLSTAVLDQLKHSEAEREASFSSLRGAMESCLRCHADGLAARLEEALEESRRESREEQQQRTEQVLSASQAASQASLSLLLQEMSQASIRRHDAFAQQSASISQLLLRLESSLLLTSTPSGDETSVSTEKEPQSEPPDAAEDREGGAGAPSPSASAQHL